VPMGDVETGEVVRLLRGSRWITDWESRYPSEEAVAQLGKRRQNRVAARLVELSKTYGLASREMSLVAVVKRMGDRPGELPDTRIVPVAVPEDTSPPQFSRGSSRGISYSLCRAVPPPLVNQYANAADATDRPSSLMSRRPVLGFSPRPWSQAGEPTASNAELLGLATMLEPDGGMPGDDPGVRTARTIAAVLAFVAAGHTLTVGAFRLHVSRLVGFLETVSCRSEMEERLIGSALYAALTGRIAQGDWLVLAREPGTSGKQIEAALK